ncbi:MAG: GFA family protein [Deltaproteobacteria bacterium]|nr:GFA family protein [Deltaproteobacteria bacterium]
MAIEGGCHCGAIRYRVNGELLGVIHCHCSDCRRWHGNYSAYAVAKLADFEFLSGEDTLKWYESSTKARRGFCPQCGSSIFKDNKDGEKIVLSVGAIDAPTGLSFLKNIFEDSKGDYYALPGA